MVKRHILGLAAACSLAFSARASLGPEVPLSPEIAMRPAAYVQDHAEVASNGRDFLVVWIDNPDWVWSSIRAMRVGADGTPASRFSQRIATKGDTPKLAAVGSDYLIVWQNSSSNSTRALRVDSDGAPLAAEHQIGPWSLPFALVSNGSTALLVTLNPFNGFNPNYSAILLDRDGNPLRILYTSNDRPLAVGVRNGRYVIVDISEHCSGAGGCRYAPTLHTLAEDGTATEVSLPLIRALSNLVLCAAFSPRAIFFGWHASSPTPFTAGYSVVGFDGLPIKPATTVPPDQFTDAFTPAAGWDGHQFLFAFSRIAGSAGALRITGDGTLIDPVPLLLTSAAVYSPPVIASSGAAQLVVWASRRFSASIDIVGRAAADFDEMANAPDQATLLSYSGTAQTSVRIARSPGAIFGVWGDESNGMITGGLNGYPITIAEAQSGGIVELPAVAAGNHVFLVTWMEESGSSGHLLGKRFDFNGHDLDPQALVVGTAASQLNALNGATLVFDGSAFLAAWPDGGNLNTIKIGEGGAPFDARTNVAVAISGAARSPRALSTGAGFLIGYSVERLTPTDSSASPPAAIAALRIGIGVTAHQPPAPPLLFDGIGSRGVPVAAALGDDRVTFAWMTDCGYRQCVTIAQSTRDGAPLLTPQVVAPISYDYNTSAEVGWDGTAFVAAWTEWSWPAGWRLRGIHLSRTGTPIEDEPFDIATDGVAGWLPFTVIGAPGGVLVAYSRADEANGGAPRAFIRTINRLPPTPPRRRGIQ